MISLASRLKRQSPSMSYGHGWIMGENGKPWHPILSAGNKANAGKRGESWLSKAIPCWLK